MKLHQFILDHMEQILAEWVSFARSIQPGEMSTRELRDHAEEMLKTIAEDISNPQTEFESTEKSKGRQLPEEGETAAEIHAECRFKSGFSIDLLASEYRALRSSVLRLWLEDNRCTTKEQTEELVRFNEAIDQALAESITRYMEANSLAQDIFLGALGHDLRDPLNAIGTGAQLLSQLGEPESRSVKLGAQLYSTVLRMNKMLDNLLNFTQSRIGVGLQLVTHYVDLKLVSKDVVEEFRLSNPDRTIQNHIEGDCIGQWDSGKLSQVYQNLISNALQYGYIDSPVVVLTRDLGDRVLFTVENKGKPIPVNSQKQIFDLMHRLPSVELERSMKKNLGLGLYIVREIVTAHHGRISVSSTDEHGTIFKVELPKNVSVACKH